MLLLCGAESVVFTSNDNERGPCEVCGSDGRIRRSVGGSGMG